jgi:CheY-like chemotaxis protein
VLCAEDFPTNQIIVRMMLEDLGHQVDVVENGALAVAACARTRYDLILMDGRMPEMDGATATRLIRAGGPLEAPVLDQHLMIVALTANASDEDRSRYLACGMDGFLTKPIDEAQLHFQLSRAIERQLQRGVELQPMPAGATGGAQHGRAGRDVRVSRTGAAAGRLPRQPAAARRPEGAHARGLRRRPAAPPRRAAMRRWQPATWRPAGLLHGLRGSAGHLGEAELMQLCASSNAADAGRLARCAARCPRCWRPCSARFERQSA